MLARQKHVLSQSTTPFECTLEKIAFVQRATKFKGVRQKGVGHLLSFVLGHFLLTFFSFSVTFGNLFFAFGYLFAYPLLPTPFCGTVILPETITEFICFQFPRCKNYVAAPEIESLTEA